MSVYIDTSAFLAVLDADDSHHGRAKTVWLSLMESREVLVCNNYVLIETHALVQHRLGMAAVRAFTESVYPILTVEWLNSDAHRQAVSALLTANRKDLSLVDCSSFNTMRQLGINKVFAFDKHFAEQGFACIVSGGEGIFRVG
jgi:predicted nucleic acid-binding protein